MVPAPGVQIGPYVLSEKIGEGGMGVVWRARDTTLDRDVAIKFLPEAFARDPERLARFEREAKAVAALAHPGIVAIHAFGEHEGAVYTVTELLEGETLRDALAAGPLPPRKAAELARRIAEALAAAHDRGIVHRDLKPENLFLTRDGRPKILDFGLASTAPPAAPAGEPSGASHTPTRTSITTPGSVLGTTDYMSPEQVRGGTIDARSDVFSFGAVLYEMLCGRRPFRRDTAVETMTAILREDPADLGADASVPAPLERVVRRCLEKRPEERFQSARDLAFAIDNATGSSTASGPRVPLSDVPPPRKGLPVAAVLGALVAGAALGALGAGMLRGAPAEPLPIRIQTITTSGSDGWPSASPDGKMIAFTSERDGRSRIWLKQLETGGEQALTEGQDTLPRFSPDGSSVLFVRGEVGGQAVFRQALVGGQARKILADAGEGEWSPDGSRIAFLRRTPGKDGTSIGVVDAQGGRDRLIVDVPKQLSGVRWSPDGTTIAATETSLTGNTPDANLLLVAPDGSNLRRIPVGKNTSIVSPVSWGRDSKSVIFARSGSVIGDQGGSVSSVVRLDLDSLEERTLFYAEGLFPNLGTRSGGMVVDACGPDRFVFASATVRETLTRHALDRSLRATGETRRLTRAYGRDRQPTYSPDGRTILFSSNQGSNLDLWILDLATGESRQITDDPSEDWDPGYFPDGRHVVWSSARSGHLEIWMANADGSGARKVTEDGVDAENPTVTRDGEWIVYWSAHPDKLGVWRIHPDGSGAERLIAGPYLQPDVSPDGRYATYLTLEINALRNVIHVLDLKEGRVLPFRIEIDFRYNRSDDVIAGRNRWTPDGKRIAFVAPDELGRHGIFVQDFDPERDTSASRRKLAGFEVDPRTESFGIAPDGESLTIAGIETTSRILIAEGVRP